MNLRMLLIGATLASLALAPGCDSSPPESETETASAAQVKQEAKDLIEATKDYGRGQQQILEREAQQSLDELNAGIQALQANLDDASDEAKAELEHALDRAQRARETIATEVADLKDASENRWERAARRMSAAMEEAREARREIGDALAGTTGDQANREEG